MGSSDPQRIGRLAPLSEVLACVDMVRAVSRRDVDASAALGRVAATDVKAGVVMPPHPVALRDGWAVRAESVAGAGLYSPVSPDPRPVWVDAGDPMPGRTDAVLAPDAVQHQHGAADVIASIAPGEGVLPAGADAAAATTIIRGGFRVRASDLATLRTFGGHRLSVRVPRVKVVSANRTTFDTSDTVGPLIAAAVEAAGGEATRIGAIDGEALARVLSGAFGDAAIVIGGTGGGRHDRSVRELARLGRVDMHGMAIRPGETAAFGSIGGRPVLLLPGRPDAALAVWLTIGMPLIARLSGAIERAGAAIVKTTRKIVSSVGIAEMVLLAREDDGFMPLASSSFPLQALAQADGWTLVSPESEGVPAGAAVTVWPLP